MVKKAKRQAEDEVVYEVVPDEVEAEFELMEPGEGVEEWVEWKRDEGEGDEVVRYTVGDWRGWTQYQCGLCAWDTLEGLEAMEEHLRTVHRPPPEPEVGIVVADKYGREKSKT